MSVVDIEGLNGSLNAQLGIELPRNTTLDRVARISEDFFKYIDDPRLSSRKSIAMFSTENSEHQVIQSTWIENLTVMTDFVNSRCVIRSDIPEITLIDENCTIERRAVLGSWFSGNELVEEACKVGDDTHTTNYYVVPPGYMFEGINVLDQVRQFMAETAVRDVITDLV